MDTIQKLVQNIALQSVLMDLVHQVIRSLTKDQAERSRLVAEYDHLQSERKRIKTWDGVGLI